MKFLRIEFDNYRYFENPGDESIIDSLFKFGNAFVI